MQPDEISSAPKSSSPAEVGRGLYLYVVEDDAFGLAQHVDNAGSDCLDEALAWAVDLRKEGMVQTLLEAGGYVNAPRLSHINLFSESSLYGDNARTYDQNVYFMWNMFTWDSFCDRIIHNAFENRDIAIMTLLLRAGAHLYGQYFHGHKLHEYDRNIVLHVIEKQDVEMMQLFIYHGNWYHNYTDTKRNWTPLMWACEVGDPCMVRLLVNNCLIGEGEGLEHYGCTMTCVHICINSGNREALRVLMENSADVNVYDGRGMSALTSAIERYMDYVDELYFRGDVGLDDADDEELDEMGERRLIISDILVYNVDFDFPGLVELPDTDIDFHQLQIDINDLPHSIRSLVDKFRHEQSVDYLRTLKHHHANVKDKWGKTALHRAVENGQFEAVKTLLLKGAQDDIPNFWGMDVLETVKMRHNDFLERLDKLSMYCAYGHRMEAGDALAAGKLPEFRRIGRYILRTRRFHKHVAPILLKAIELSGLNIDGDQFLRDLQFLSVEED